MVMDLLRGMRRSGPQYLVGSDREAKCAHLGYKTRLSMLHTLDPPPLAALAFLRSSHSGTPDPKQENNQRTLDRSQVPQVDPPVTRLHNSD
jgi:hypothetical protein